MAAARICSRGLAWRRSKRQDARDYGYYGVSHDVRSVANRVLQIAAANDRPVTNLALNKILYFLHAGFLHEYGTSLISAKIEAWDHGPVFREIYHQFKKFGREPISEKARRLDPLSGTLVEVPISLNSTELVYVDLHASELIKLSPGRLVDMSHVRDGPWYTARYGDGRLNPGVEITDELIRKSGEMQARH